MYKKVQKIAFLQHFAALSKKRYESDLTFLGYLLYEVLGVAWYSWLWQSLTFDPMDKMTGGG